MTCKCLCLKSQSKKKHSSNWIIFFFFSLCCDDLRCTGVPLSHDPCLTSQRSSCVTNSDAAWMAGRDYFLHKQSLLIRYGWLMTTLKRKYKPTNHPTQESRKTIIYQLLTTKSSQCPDGHWLILKWLIKPPSSNSLWRGSFWEEEWRDLWELSQQDVCPLQPEFSLSHRETRPVPYTEQLTLYWQGLPLWVRYWETWKQFPC